MKYDNEVIFCIVNEGYSQNVMDAARRAGARGGTVVRSHGTANADAEKMFGITISPQKEIVIMLVESSVRDDILHALYGSMGLDSPGQGIAFSMPVDGVAGVWKPSDAKTADTAEPETTEDKA